MKQKIRQLLDDEGAVSPVIGVILMVAITVILAAVIGTFVLGLGDQVSQTAPQTSLQVESVSGSNVTISHQGSDTLVASETRISVSGDMSASASSSSDAEFSTADSITIELGSNLSVSNWGTWNYDSSSGTPFGSGDSITISFVDKPSGQIIAEKQVD